MTSRGSDRTLVVAAGACAAVGAIGVAFSSDAIEATASLWLVHAIALTLFLAARRPAFSASAVVIAAGIAVLLPTVWTVQSVLVPESAGGSGHDGGVIVTRAAATHLLDGSNPYQADFTASLPDEWQMISMDGSAESAIPNPVRTRYPYLPAAFLAMVPINSLGSNDSAVGDPRWVMLLTYAGAMVAIGTWPRTERWARIAALATIGGPLTLIHLAGGTNDAWGAALVVIAARLIPRHAVAAGVFAALAVSVKFFLLPGLLVWAAWTWHAEGWTTVRRYWSAPLTLALTSLPFVVWSPGDFMDDTLWFWLGRGDDAFPVSGLGLPAAMPTVFHGPLLAVAAVVALAASVRAAWALLSRFELPAAGPPAVGLVTLGVLIPARTFQGNYLVVVAGLFATVPMLVASTRQAGFSTAGDRDVLDAAG